MDLKIGTTGDYAPLSYIDSVTGQFVGEDIEFAKQLAISMKREPVFVKTSWTSLLEDLEAGRFDLAISGITPTSERNQCSYISYGYRRNGKTLICRKEDAEKFRKLEELNRPEFTVVENYGGTNEYFTRKHLPLCRLLMCENNEDAPKKLLSKEADFMITDLVEAEYLASVYEEIAAPMSAHTFTDEECCVLVGRQHAELLEETNRFIGKYRKSRK